MRFSLAVILVISFLFLHKESIAQDTLVIRDPGVARATISSTARDTTKKYNPNKAVIRSAILPGWGQITNRKIWKAPIVWAALGITGGVFVHNIKQYREAKQAYILASDGNVDNDYLIKQPYFSVKDQPERIRTFRNQVRQNVDYTVLFFIAFWGLNVADAAVDAHLKTFDVSDELSLQFKPGYSPMANTNGVSLVLHIGK